MHVDFRPRLLLLIGMSLVMLTVIFGYMDIASRWIDLWHQVQHAYQIKHGKELDLIDYLSGCLPKASCRQAYAKVSGVGNWTLILLHTNFIMGLIFLAVSRFWKPERWYRRQARVASARMNDWYEKSNTRPKGTLVPKKVGAV